MIIKRFQAKTEQEAVENAKKELGPGVVIMNVKNVKKKGLFAIFKKNMVEVTVALEEENERTPLPAKTAPAAKEGATQSQAQDVSQQVSEKPPSLQISVKSEMKFKRFIFADITIMNVLLLQQTCEVKIYTFA